MNPEIRDFVRRQVKTRFLSYAKVFTTSDEAATTKPSTAQQWQLLRQLDRECRELGLTDVHTSDNGYVYAKLPASPGSEHAEAFGLLAHVDTSPEQPGDHVVPRCLEKWDGSSIGFPDDPDLTLTTDDSPELESCIGDTIITASGRTLLGADDKAGLAEIMAAMATFVAYPELVHGPIRICFTSDEEVGRGTEGLDLDRLPEFCYTLDGSTPGELEAECFDAWKVVARFRGVGVHPGFAKDKMVHAGCAGAHFVAGLPRGESPERTSGREGFYYVVHVDGDVEQSTVHLIVRDFEASENRRRIEFLDALARDIEARFPGLSVELESRPQYQNMRDLLREHPHVIDRAAAAIGDTGLEVVHKSIRGGTDGSVLTQLGHPTPNIFAGGQLFHSKKEWVALGAMEKATETILHLARHWALA